MRGRRNIMRHVTDLLTSRRYARDGTVRPDDREGQGLKYAYQLHRRSARAWRLGRRVELEQGDRPAPDRATIMGVPVHRPLWKDRQSWFLIAEEDRMIAPETHRFMAARMGANARERLAGLRLPGTW